MRLSRRNSWSGAWAMAAMVAFGCGDDGAADAAEPRADGALGVWQQLDAMPVPRANHCAAVIGDTVYVIGGNYRPSGGTEFVRIDAVHAATWASDGTLGPWTPVGTLPSAVSECTAAAHGDTLLVIDGIYDDAGHGAQVWAATVGDDGMLSAFEALGALPTDTRTLSAQAWVHDDALFVMGGALPDAGDNVFTLRAAIGAEGLGAWTTDAWHDGWLGRPQYAFTGDYVYVLGGYLGADAGNESVAEVAGAPIASDGTGARFATTELPAPTTFGRAVAIDDWIFAVGGRAQIFGASGRASVWAAHVGADGSLGDWAVLDDLPEGRSNHQLAVVGDTLLVLGGGFDGPGLDTVFAARARRLPDSP